MKRREITVVNHYNVLLYNHGGVQAIKGLYRSLSRWFDINIVIFVDEDMYKDDIKISDYIKVKPIVLPSNLVNKRIDFYKEYNMSKETICDEAPFVAKYLHGNEEIISRVSEIAKNSIIVIAEHVYTWRLIKKACHNNHLWYRAQNVEYDYKRITWNSISSPKVLIDDVFDIEKECCKEAECILAISEEESKRFRELYGLTSSNRNKIINIHAGYDSYGVDPVLPSKRKKISDYDYAGFFISSDVPNARVAVGEYLEIAKYLPNIQFVIAGDICKSFYSVDKPQNVSLAGVVSDNEKNNYLTNCDFALNLLESGAGVNIKMLEYFTYGLPVITTEHGARGINVENGKECIITNIKHAVEDIKKFCLLSRDQKDTIAINAAKLLQKNYSWEIIGNKVLRLIEHKYHMNFDKDAVPYDNTKFFIGKSNAHYLPKGDFYIRCAGEYGRGIAELLKKYKLYPKAFVEKDDNYFGKCIDGIPIISINEYITKGENSEIIIANKYYWSEIVADLIKHGVQLDKIIISWEGKYLFSLNDGNGSCFMYHEPQKYKNRILSLLGTEVVN